jgi:hypothetical protein
MRCVVPQVRLRQPSTRIRGEAAVSREQVLRDEAGSRQPAIQVIDIEDRLAQRAEAVRRLSRARRAAAATAAASR